METTLTIAPKAIAVIPYMATQAQHVDTQVPRVKAVEGAPTLPADKFFVAQVVTARLSGTAFPENPSEIAPPERTLKPYNMPMLPAEKEEPPVEATTTDDPAIGKPKEAKEPAATDDDEKPQLPELKETEAAAEPETQPETPEIAKPAEPQVAGELADRPQTNAR